MFLHTMRSSLFRLAASSLLCSLMLYIGFVSLPPDAHAQGALKIAAVVNDEAISEMDVYTRAKLMMVSSGAPDSPATRQRMLQKALKDLIDESLQLQEAKRLELEVAEEEISNAFAGIGKQNGLSGEQFEQALQQSGVGSATLKRQIRAKISWVQAVRRIFGGKVDVSDGEIDAALAETLAKAHETSTEYEISEIFLPVTNPEQFVVMERQATQLIDRLRSGENFAALAQQYSRASSSTMGGSVGWVRALALPAEIATALERMGPGQVSTPLRTKNGVYLVRLENRRRANNSGALDPNAGKAELHLKQIFVPVTSDMTPSQEAYMKRVADTARTRLTSCEAIPQILTEFNLRDYSELGWMKEEELPSQLAQSLLGLKIGQPSQTIRLEEGYSVVVICARRVIPGKQPERQEIANRLRSEKLELMARRHLRDLHRQSIIDIRMAGQG